jgi:tRNA 2-thiouridine synthesizing protein A
MNYDQDLDTTGLLCPLPVLKAAKRLRSMAAGDILRMVADDPASIIDVPHFCAEQGFELQKQEIDNAPYTYFIYKTP